jgi:hypothetical protein
VPKFNIHPGPGLEINDNKVGLKIEPGMDNIIVSSRGVYIKSGGSKAVLDNWTIVSNKPSETQNLLIRGNDRVIQTCYYLSFLKGERVWYDSSEGKRAIETKSPNVAEASDLKNCDDIIREVNFPCWYPQISTVDGRRIKSSPAIMLRPGSLIVLGDDTFPSTIGTSRICETGFRFSTHSMYDESGSTKYGEQKAWALFVVTSITLDKCSTYESIIDWTTFPSAHEYSEYPIIRNLTLRCLWSVDENETNYGYTFTNSMKDAWWSVGDIITGEFDPTNLYGTYVVSN